MATRLRRSATLLLLVGLICGLFFWVTDPRWGVMIRTSQPLTVIDVANWSMPGTWLGLSGSVVICLIAGWLFTRPQA